MTEHTVMSIDAQRDHGFHVPRPDLTLQIGTPNACGACHAKRGDEWAAKAVVAWRAGSEPRTHFAERMHARESGGSAAGGQLASLVGDSAAPAIARATALLELAADPRRDQIDKAARASDPLLRLAAARAAANLSPRERVLGMVRLLEDPLRAVRIEAATALADVPDEELSEGQRGARHRALDEYRAALVAASDSPASHANLAVLLQQQGDAATAEAAYLTALRLDDTFVPAYTGLANLYASQNREADGTALLRRGIARLPESADLRFAHGVLLGRLEQIKPALAELAEAVRLGPESAYFAYAYAVSLNEAGQSTKALRVLRSALKLHPLDQNLLGSTAVIAGNAGRFDEALAAAKRLEASGPAGAGRDGEGHREPARGRPGSADRARADRVESRRARRIPCDERRDQRHRPHPAHRERSGPLLPVLGEALPLPRDEDADQGRRHRLLHRQPHRRPRARRAAGGSATARSISSAPGSTTSASARASREDVDAVHAFVRELGAKIVHPPEEGAFAPGYYSVLFEDPDGIRIEVNHVPGKGHLGTGGRLGEGGAGPATGLGSGSGRLRRFRSGGQRLVRGAARRREAWRSGVTRPSPHDGRRRRPCTGAARARRRRHPRDPGITPEVARFGAASRTKASPPSCRTCSARRASRCRSGYALGQMARACVSREFHVLARARVEPDHRLAARALPARARASAAAPASARSACA